LEKVSIQKINNKSGIYFFAFSYFFEKWIDTKTSMLLLNSNFLSKKISIIAILFRMFEILSWKSSSAFFQA